MFEFIIRFHIQTWFIGECGRDTGRVTRELWRLFGYCLVGLCEGTPNCLVFRHDSGRVSVRFREYSLQQCKFSVLFPIEWRLSQYWCASRNVYYSRGIWLPFLCSISLPIYMREGCLFNITRVD